MKMEFVSAHNSAHVLWTIEEPTNVTKIPKVGEIVKAPSHVPNFHSGRVAEKPFRHYGPYYGQLDVTVPLNEAVAKPFEPTDLC